MKIPHPGALRERVTLQTPVRVPDSGGGYITTWTTLATVWAAIEAAGSRQTLEADRQQTIARYRLTLRNRADISAGMRVLWRGDTWRVTALPLPESGAAYRTLEITDDGGMP